MGLNKLKEWFRINKLKKIRKYALQYIYLIDMQMKHDNLKRPLRRQFWRELVKQGRFYDGKKKTFADLKMEDIRKT